jgi:hypothetical protein
MMNFVYASTGLLAYLVYKELRLSNPITLLSIAMIAFVPAYTKIGAQFLPSPFSILYIFASILFLLKLLKKPDSTMLVVSAAVCFFLAYGSKVTNLYFLPAIVVFIYVAINRAALAKFLGILAALYLLEQIINAQTLGYFSFFSRLEFMAQHASIMDNRPYQLQDILGRWLMLPNSYLAFLLLSMVASIGVLLVKNKQTPAFLFAVMILVYAFLFTFTISSLSPLKFVEPLRTRYFFPLAMLTYLAMPVLLVQLFPKQLWISIAALLSVLLINIPSTIAQSNLKLFAVNEYADLIDTYYRRGVWLLFSEQKAARMHRAIYLSDQSLFESGADIPVFGKVYSTYFKAQGMHIPLFINLVRSPPANEYILLDRNKTIGGINAFVPPELRQTN